MPKGPKSVGQLCAELGMEAVAETNFRKESQAYLKDHIDDVPNALDEDVEKLALKFLNGGAGPKHFSWDAELNYQWEAADHRLTIVTYVGDIIKQQRWYIIDRLHKRVKGAAHCPGCLLHKPRPNTGISGHASIGYDGHDDDNTALTDDSEVDSIHHVATKSDGVQASESRKRTRASLGYEPVSSDKRRKSSASEDSAETVEGAKRGLHLQASANSNTIPAVPNVRASGFTPVNAGVVVEVPRLPATAPTLTQTLSLKDFSYAMRYRGKTWHFNNIAHKAKVLEQILLQEEKDVESYPILAFSKGARKATLGGEEDSDAEESVLKDYFKFYTHFMHERFPSNEKILLANGVKPTA